VTKENHGYGKVLNDFIARYEDHNKARWAVHATPKEHRMSDKVWFITGASRRFGRVWTEAALKRGDKVVATARSLAGVAGLTERYGKPVLPLALDVANPDQVKRVVTQAHTHLGRLDVVLNSATGLQEVLRANLDHSFATYN
jgi:NAD(P)-dependent dehydrogenase (short-subunit alcohol dehydrogenase family)